MNVNMAKLSRPKPMSHKAGFGKGRPYNKGGKVGK
jgi:hypothetical protein